MMGINLTKAAADVLSERGRQQLQEGWTMEHDDAHSAGEMAKAAAVYALAASVDRADRAMMDESRTAKSIPNYMKLFWPWDEAWLKPTTQRRDLIKAGALILAEIERLDRMQERQGAQ